MARISFTPGRISNDPNVVHTSTTWQVCRQPTFLPTDSYVVNEVKDTVNLSEFQLDYKPSYGEILYIRYKTFYSNNEESEWSRVITTSKNQEGFKFSNVVIVTPLVKLTENNLEPTKIDVITSKYLVFLGKGTHTSTTWIVEDTSGVELFRREKDEDNLTKISLPINMFKNHKAYTIKAQYHNSLNGMSNFGKTTFTRDLYSNIIEFNQDQQLLSNTINYLKFKILTTGIFKINTTLKNTDGKVLTSSEIDLTINEPKFEYLTLPAISLIHNNEHLLEITISLNGSPVVNHKSIMKASSKEFVFNKDLKVIKNEVVDTAPFLDTSFIDGYTGDVLENSLTITGDNSILNTTEFKYLQGHWFNDTVKDTLNITGDDLPTLELAVLKISYSNVIVLAKLNDASGNPKVDLIRLSVSPTGSITKLSQDEVYKIPPVLATVKFNKSIVQLGLDTFLLSGYDNTGKPVLIKFNTSTKNKTETVLPNGIVNKQPPTITRITDHDILMVYHSLKVEIYNIIDGSISERSSLPEALFTVDGNMTFVNNTNLLLLNNTVGDLVSLDFKTDSLTWGSSKVIRNSTNLGHTLLTDTGIVNTLNNISKRIG